MNVLNSPSAEATAADVCGVKFGRGADGMPVTRVGDLVFAMLPSRDGGHLLASAWRLSRQSPLSWRGGWRRTSR